MAVAATVRKHAGKLHILALICGWVTIACGSLACGRTGPWDLFDNQGVGADNPGGGGSGATGNTGGTGATGNTGGTGGGPPCVLDTDCDDLDWCTTDRCQLGQCSYGPKDDDDDSFIDELCGGADCNDLNPNVHPGLPEDCDDGSDNNCDGVSDCFDPACLNDPTCGCQPSPFGEDCDNGQDDDCDTTVDCNDADCINTPICGCAANEVGACVDGFDNDCDSQIDCADSDCFSDPTCGCQAINEICTNNQDEDCDLLIDCSDPDCQGTQACACQPPGTPEVCNDGVDNDCDEHIDCADLNCLASPFCQSCSPEICNDGIDNNCDEHIDCADLACAFDPNCTAIPEICNNSLDDDNDTLIDCQDPDCANNPICVQKQSNCLSPKLISGSGTHTGDTTGNIGEHIGSCGGGAGEAVFYFILNEASFVHLDSVGTSFDSVLYVKSGSCEYGTEIGCDDDSGGFQWSAALDFTILYPGTYFIFLDGFTIDPQLGANEGPFVLNVQIIPQPAEVCSDGIDNDGDIYVDCADPNCTSFPSCFNCNQGTPPSAEFGVAKCTDGQDNDCDGLTDAADDDCNASDYFLTEQCNGLDQNDNGIVDDFNCRCANSSHCEPPQICYTHTLYACGLPCDFFFGNVCPAVAPGSYCNLTSQQCEF